MVEMDGSPVGDAAAGADAGGGLRAGVLPLWGVFAQSIGVLAPTTTLALAIAVIASYSGDATWLTWLVTSVGVLGIGWCITWLARRFITTSGLYGYGALAGGSTGGYWQGGFQLTANLVTMPALVIGSGIYLTALLARAGLSPGRPEQVVIYVVLTALMTAVACSDVRLSARVLLVMELVSVTLIVVLLLIVLVASGHPVFDSGQLALHGLGAHSLFVGIAFAVYSMAGWENAAVLGREASNPRRDIPLAMMGSVVFIALLYVFASYVEVLGLPGTALAQSPAPLNSLAHVAGIGWFAWIIDACVAISFFSSGLGVLTSTARVLYTLGGERLAPRALHVTNANHRSPWIAVLVVAVPTAVVSVIAALTAKAQLSAYGYIGTLAGYALVLSYFTATVIALRLAVRTRALGPLLALAGLLAAGAVVCAIYFSYHPFPTGAYGTVAWIFIGVVAALAFGYGIARVAGRSWFDRIGASAQTIADPVAAGDDHA